MWSDCNLERYFCCKKAEIHEEKAYSWNIWSLYENLLLRAKIKNLETDTGPQNSRTLASTMPGTIHGLYAKQVNRKTITRLLQRRKRRTLTIFNIDNDDIQKISNKILMGGFFLQFDSEKQILFFWAKKSKIHHSVEKWLSMILSEFFQANFLTIQYPL